MSQSGSPCYRILEGSDTFNAAAFEYPSGVVVRPAGGAFVRRGMEYWPLEIVQGVICTVDGRIVDRIYYGPRHVGGDITNDSIVIYADVGGFETNVGWFGVEPI